MNSCKIKLELVKEFLWESGNTVETVALLQKSNWESKPGFYVKLSLDMEDYYRIKDQEK